MHQCKTQLLVITSEHRINIVHPTKFSRALSVTCCSSVTAGALPWSALSGQGGGGGIRPSHRISLVSRVKPHFLGLSPQVLRVHSSNCLPRMVLKSMKSQEPHTTPISPIQSPVGVVLTAVSGQKALIE